MSLNTIVSSLPSSLPIVPLSDYVLLPSIVTILNLCSSEAQALIKSRSPYLICVPYAKNPKHRTDLSQLFSYGCVAQIIDYEQFIPDRYSFRVKGICRSRVRDISSLDGSMFEALLEHYPEEDKLDPQDVVVFQSLCHSFMTKMRAIGVSPSVLDQFRRRLERCHVSHVANLLLCVTDVAKQDKLRVLEIADMKERLCQVNQAIHDHLQTINRTALKSGNDMLFDQVRRKFYLLQELNSIAVDDLHVEQDGHFSTLPEDDEETIDLVIKLNHAKLPEHAAIAIKRDLNRLRKLPPSSSDAAVIKTYIEYVSELPWSTTRQEGMQELHISSVKHQLDADHFGMDTVKNRILEYLSILKIKQDATPPILCFVGPPGVGKTTLGISIARALQRKFHRISLGGVRDEAEIRGHRRTYVGALPGLLIHGMRQCGVQNPVMLLDEIDKLVINSNQGDPAAALLEVLDPAQNATFNDHFINIPYDLSQVVFIATANSLDTIPRPLLDRMEVIQLDGYTFHEKLHISQTHLVPKQIKAHGLSDVGGIDLSKEVLLHIAERYTRESGVRQLERLIASVCRYKCKEYADLIEDKKLGQFSKTIHVHELEHILGVEPYENEVLDTEEIPGIINGLAYTGSGNGGVMAIEANCMPGTGQLKLTGSLGDVIKESAQLAVSWIKSNAYELKLTNSPKQDILKDVDLHIHMPSGAIPKDGPSAGITMTTCLVSLLSGHQVPKTTAMTGEITLRGQVRPVGGIKEKVISAHRAGIKRILLPIANRRDVIHDVPIEVQKEIQLVYCKSMWDVIEAAFDQIHTSFEPKHRCRL